MALIDGTNGNDTIHMVGDGVPVDGTDIVGTTDGADTVAAGAGDDDVHTHAGDDAVDGGSGDDAVDAGAGDDLVEGGDGNDTIVGGQGRDTLVGGIGQDVFVVRAGSEIDGLGETILGGADIDTLDLRTFAVVGPVDLSGATIDGVEVLLLAGNDVTLSAAALSGFARIEGAAGLDRLVLDAAGTVDLAGASVAGIDEFRGSAGRDGFLFAGVAQGQVVRAGGGNDRVAGGLGNDNLAGEDGRDRLAGGLGGDTLNGGAGNDTLAGDDGNDNLVGGRSADVLSGGGGNDNLRIALVSEVDGLAERLDGGEDYDRLDFQTFGAAGRADLTAATIVDVEELDLGGTEVVLDPAQLDRFVAVVGGAAIDRVVLGAAGVADLSGATILGVEELRGSAGADGILLDGVAGGQFVTGQGGDDTLRGGLAGDRLFGGDGVDVLAGGDGPDTLVGGAGADTVAGGVGNDVVRVGQVSDIDGLAEVISGGSDLDRLDFQTFGAAGKVDLSAATLAGLEELALSGNVVTLAAAQLGAFDWIGGAAGTDVVVLAAAGVADLGGATILAVDAFRGSAWNDRIHFGGVATGQTVDGAAGRDTVTGSDGDDRLGGGTGADRLAGNAGDDVLYGAFDRDVLEGGLGADRFDFDSVVEMAVGAGRDVVLDFVHGEDVLDLADVDASTEAQGNQAFAFVAAFTGAAGQLRLSGAILAGDVDGDGSADFEIGLVGSPALAASDIAL